MADNAAEAGGLFQTIVSLVNIGFAGVGVAVLLLVFVILMRGKAADSETNDLYKRFMAWGMSFAFFCGILAVIGPLVAPRPVISAPPEMLLSFSPSFTTEGLPAPSITLPNGNSVDAGARFPAQPGQILVRVDDALKQVQTLKQTAVALAETAASAQKQADTAVAALTSAQSTPSAPVSNAQEQAEAASKQSQTASIDIVKSIRAGDFTRLEQQNHVLDSATKASISARTRVIGAARGN